MAFGMQEAQGDAALTFTAQGAGTVVSGALAAAGAAAYVLLLVHVTAVGGTPSLAVSLEQSANGTSGWAAVAGSAITPLTAIGNAVAFAVPTANFVRVTATVSGGTPSVTGTVATVTFPE
jgi:hypothetical protein